MQQYNKKKTNRMHSYTSSCQKCIG